MLIPVLSCGGDPAESSSSSSETTTVSSTETEPTSGGSEGGGSEGGGSEGGGACPDAIVDGSFEEGPLTVGWSFGSANWETPICNATCYAGGNRAFDGDWWVWFGGVPVPESAFVSQRVPLVIGSAELVFRVLIIAETPSASDTFTVLLDDDNVFSISALDAAEYEEYREVTLDLGAYADGSLHTLSFDANFDGMSTTSFFLDAVELHNCAR